VHVDERLKSFFEDINADIALNEGNLQTLKGLVTYNTEQLVEF